KIIRDGTGYRNMRINLIELQKQEKELTANLKAEHPRLMAVRKKIKNVQHSMEVSAEVAFGGLLDRRKALMTHLKALESAEYRWQAKNLMAIQRQGELTRLASIVTRFNSNYSGIYSRLHDMRVSHELKTPHFRLVEPVKTADKLTWPDPQKILILALAMGLGSGFGLALLVQVLDNRIQSIDDVEKILKIPFLGGIPYWVHGGLEKTARPIVTEEHSTGAVEAYRSLRTTVVAELGKINQKLVFVTSADSKEGKTLTTLNLVIMLTQLDKKVLLVDMDLRRGRIHKSLGLPKGPGFNDVMRDKLDLVDVIVQSRVDNLDIITAGTTIDNCAELLQDTDLHRLFAEIEDDYDYIFVDTAPVLRVTDTVILATQRLGVVLYVARVNKSPVPLIRYSLSMLSDARILGLVMNSIEMHKISSLYYTYQYPNYAYYSNAYAYGYNYYYYGDHPGKDGGRDGRRGRYTAISLDRLAQWFRRTFLPME
ncbi:MAG: polysaccharide biosynthesis tyrosine autokinase, partial [Kiritimatiellae bacterium]|nr:polysaccharide biosynthesis tyrosine autokinase [Kiritimatiellia bacterium]